MFYDALLKILGYEIVLYCICVIYVTKIDKWSIAAKKKLMEHIVEKIYSIQEAQQQNTKLDWVRSLKQ